MKPMLTLVCLLNISLLSAQQRPHYTQYILNNYIINPAVAGIEDYWDLKISHRHQWMGINGAPVTTYLTLQGPLRKSLNGRETATTLHSDEENPRGESYWKDYTSTDPHAGIGFTILNDRAGPLNRFSFTATYAYHLPVGERTSISAGISVGVQNMTLHTSDLDFGSDHPYDPAIASNDDLNRLRPDINAGLWLYSANFFAGVAAQNIVPSTLSFANDSVKVSKGKLVPHVFITGGYRFMLNDDISFLPSIMIRYITPLPVNFDVNAKVQYRDFIWAGASYRREDGYAAMIGINVNSTFNIGYSYDYTTSKLNAVSTGSHEIVLGFLLGNKFGDWCPRNLW